MTVTLRHLNEVIASRSNNSISLRHTVTGLVIIHRSTIQFTLLRHQVRNLLGCNTLNRTHLCIQEETIASL